MQMRLLISVYGSFANMWGSHLLLSNCTCFKERLCVVRVSVCWFLILNRRVVWAEAPCAGINWFLESRHYRCCIESKTIHSCVFLSVRLEEDWQTDGNGGPWCSACLLIQQRHHSSSVHSQGIMFVLFITVNVDVKLHLFIIIITLVFTGQDWAAETG